MLQRASVKMLPVVNRASDLAPVAPACCNVCRICVTTNLVGLVTGGAVALAATARRLTRRIGSPVSV
jgi:hypothetical protein